MVPNTLPITTVYNIVAAFYLGIGEVMGWVGMVFRWVFWEDGEKMGCVAVYILVHSLTFPT